MKTPIRSALLAVAACAAISIGGAAVADPAYVQVFSSTSRGAGTYNSNTYQVDHAVGSRFHLRVSATATHARVDVKIQEKDQVSGQYLDVSGMAFATQTTTGNVDLEVYPGIAATSNRKVSGTLPTIYRAVMTVTSAAATASLSNTYVPPIN